VRDSVEEKRGEDEGRKRIHVSSPRSISTSQITLPSCQGNNTKALNDLSAHDGGLKHVECVIGRLCRLRADEERQFTGFNRLFVPKNNARR
jgi:hypothetical protein